VNPTASTPAKPLIFRAGGLDQYMIEFDADKPHPEREVEMDNVAGDLVVKRTQVHEARGQRSVLPALMFVLALSISSVRAGEPTAGAATAKTDAAAIEFFEKSVRPILVQRCQGCHGPTKQKGGLRLDSRQGALAGGSTGPAVVPGQPGKSLLIDAVNYGEVRQMPPRSKLPAEEIAVLTRWVTQVGDANQATVAEGSGRLELARRMVDPRANPLLRRVLVNRLWQHHFGEGLVRTVDDFGVMGQKPSHPELLDWLAGEFVARGWSIKAMHRLMVTSTTYRMSSSLRSDAERLDPSNVHLHRMNVRRLEAETIRDAILAPKNPIATGSSASSRPLSVGPRPTTKRADAWASSRAAQGPAMTARSLPTGPTCAMS